jgi:hypothetical protein
MNGQQLKQKCLLLKEGERQERDELVTEIKALITSRELATQAILHLLDGLNPLIEGQETGDTGAYQTVRDPDLAVSIIELLHHGLEKGGELSSGVTAIARLHHLDRRESTKSDTELYFQYRACALLDLALSLDVAFSDEAIQIILASGKRYVSNHATKEYMCSMYWRLAEQGVNISPVIQSLTTIFHNHRTDELVQKSLLALWAAVRKGYFDTPIPDSDKTQQIWLHHLIGDATYKLKRKELSEFDRTGIVGCLLAIVTEYPDLKELGLEYLEKCKIREPKRPTNDYQHDLREYFKRCREFVQVDQG